MAGKLLILKVMNQILGALLVVVLALNATL